MQMPTQQVAEPGVTGQANQAADHASMAMQAARRVARARRKSQKEKMGRVVCHHLLCLLNEEAPRRKAAGREALRRARPLVTGHDRQGSLGF
ncbi:MAG: hypothetical protein ACFHX7_02430 [Pseudomonadota bacterium]